MQGGSKSPEWLNVNFANMSGSMLAVPGREDIDIQLNEQLIVEYYNSR